jgi:hypothetical protein
MHQSIAYLHLYINLCIKMRQGWVQGTAAPTLVAYVIARPISISLGDSAVLRLDL